MSGQAKTVLILDDEEAVRESLVDYFEDQRWRVVSASTGEEALETIARERPDCAVVDIRLPGMNGNAFIRAASARFPWLVYVISTGSPEYYPPDDVLALPQVCGRVFSKPVMELVEIEEALLEMRGAGNK